MTSARLPVIAGLETYPIPCPAGHDVVYGLANGSGNEIYLAASNEFTPGLCAHVLAFDVVTHRFRVVIDVQRETGFDAGSGLMPHSKIHLALRSTSTGRVFAATHFTAPGIGQTSFDPITAYRGKYAGCYLLEYDPRTDRVTNHGLLVPGEGARIGCLDERHHQFYFISYPRNHLYRYDYRRRSLNDVGRVGQENSFGLEADGAGNVYTSDDLGRVLRYSRRANRIEELDLFLPLAPGRQSAGNYIRRMIRGLDGSFLGFANKGARLFRLAADGTSLDDHGVIVGRDDAVGHRRPILPPAKALAQIDARTLLVAFGGDGIYLDDHPVPNLIRYDLVRRQAVDCGKFVCPADGTPAWIPQCALAVPRARAAFFGLQQTSGPLRLWKVNLARLGTPRRVPLRAPYRRHLAQVAAKPFGASVEGAEPLRFVRHGHVRLHELGWRGEDLVVPVGETAIAALHFDPAGTLYGVTTGARAHLFAFAPYAQNRFTENYDVHPWDLGAITADPTDAAKFLPDPKRSRLLVAIQTSRTCTISAFQPGAERSRYRPVYHSVPHWPPVPGSSRLVARQLEVPKTAIAFKNLTYLPAPDMLVGTTADGSLLRIDWNGTMQPVRLGAAVLPHGLGCVGEDQLFAVCCTAEVRLLRLTPDARPEVLAVVRELDLTPSCFAAAKRAPLAIGGCDGRVEIIEFARPGKRLTLSLRHRWTVRALAWQSGRLYGFYGTDEGVGEAFSIDPISGAKLEIGILQVSSEPRYWMCHRCDAMAAGTRGDVYFGEHDRIAHLFRYVAEPVPSPHFSPET